MVSREEARLSILTTLIPAASRVGLTDPTNLINTTQQLEDFIFSKKGDDEPESPELGENNVVLQRQPRKKRQSSDPAHADKSNQ